MKEPLHSCPSNKPAVKAAEAVGWGSPEDWDRGGVAGKALSERILAVERDHPMPSELPRERLL